MRSTCSLAGRATVFRPKTLTVWPTATEQAYYLSRSEAEHKEAPLTRQPRHSVISAAILGLAHQRLAKKRGRSPSRERPRHGPPSRACCLFGRRVAMGDVLGPANRLALAFLALLEN